MKASLLLFILLFSFASTAADKALYLSVKKKDNSTRSGELIESYEDRWFYEEQSDSTKKYLLLFEVVKKRPVFHMIDTADIKRIRLRDFKRSSYKRFLKRHGIILRKEVVPNQHVLTGHEGHHKHERMFGNFAWDLGVLDHDGQQFSGGGLKNEDYYIFNRPVYSPISGTVVGKVSDQPDNPASPELTGDLSQKINNYLTIEVKYPFYLSLVHFKKDSITVNIGDKVEAGQDLGLVGNSGVSYIPHLHYTLYIYEESLKRFISVPALVK